MSEKNKQSRNRDRKNERDQNQIESIIGLGKFSARKSYYPELQKKIQELKEEKNKFERIFSGALNGIFQAKPDGAITVANNAMVTLCDYSSEEELLSIENIREQLFFNPGEYDRLISRLSEENTVLGFETQFKRLDNSPVDVSLNAAFRQSPDGDYLECFVQDITEKKKAEEELKNARNYITNIIDSMTSVLIGIDSYGNVTHWNRTAIKSTGISSEEAQGKSIQDVLPKIKSEVNSIIESIGSGQQKNYPKRQYETDTGICYEDITVFPLAAGKTNGAVIRIDDVTNKVRMEEMMIQSEKMLSVGGLAAGMAHEINNPVAGMTQTAKVMANRLTDLDIPANQRAAEEAGISVESIKQFMEKRGIINMLDTINDSGLKISKIVSSMLSFARKSDTTLIPHDPAHLIDDILKLAETDYDLKKQYDFKTITIIKEYETGLPLLPCEGGEIQQVLLNLLRNGAQAMQSIRKNGKDHQFIIRLYRDEQKNMLCIEIEDNGPGMDELTRKRIFEPFFTTKPVGIGTGLGLYISYFIITENHGGEMSVESKPGEGTKFTVRLPFEKR